MRNAPGDDRGILATYLGADGDLAELLYIPAGGAAEPLTEDVLRDRRHLMRMAGREVFKAAVLAMSRSTDEAIRRAGMPPEAIDLLVPHQANLRIIEATAKHAEIPMEKVMVNLDRYGNTSSASIPLALVQAREEGRLKPGMIVMLVAFGAGFTWGSVVLRW
jgi:3-oxoacyl-[acyl-carrier-protein] synthase-3